MIYTYDFPYISPDFANKDELGIFFSNLYQILDKNSIADFHFQGNIYL